MQHWFSVFLPLFMLTRGVSCVFAFVFWLLSTFFKKRITKHTCKCYGFFFFFLIWLSVISFEIKILSWGYHSFNNHQYDHYIKAQLSQFYSYSSILCSLKTSSQVYEVQVQNEYIYIYKYKHKKIRERKISQLFKFLERY